MQTFIALLRGINVGGHKKISMADLKALFLELGFENVTTYIQSGNVVFNAKPEGSKKVADAIEQAILARLRFDVAAVVLTRDELKDALHNNPFLQEKGIEDATLYFTFLKEVPAEEDALKLSALSIEPERFVIKNKVIYLHCVNGYGNTKINSTLIEKKLKVKATTRNLNTINKLLSLAAME